MKRFFADYGMIFALLVLGVLFSWLTWDEQHPTGASGGRQLGKMIVKQTTQQQRIVVLARDGAEDRAFTEELAAQLAGKREIVAIIHGSPQDARKRIDQMLTEGSVDLLACTPAVSTWPMLSSLPQLSEIPVLSPEPYHWPNFLKADNLLNVANQIVVIAVLAIGMTLVIITAGIDLSVGSLLALAAVASTWLIRDAAGGEAAGTLGVVLCCLAAIALAAAVGLFSGAMVTGFNIPPFIVTLAMMLVASGLAYTMAGGQSIYQVPDSFAWLGRGTALGSIPNSVVLMILLYIIAHVMMSKTVLGRYIYAIGGNLEAARLSGVPVKRVILLVYLLNGALAGLGGIITASQLKSGAPTYGIMYELYVIAAVVVGGTSLMGGQGKIFGTLIGAFIIAVIQNGMNLTGVGSYMQKVVLGFVILAAVLLDTLKRRGTLNLGKLFASKTA
ncbi:MAG TPA: sugar-transporting ATPase [Lentisphaeria bacterium]|jgi:ribose transport system permease protein|nr:sugar-transporting ATPase [Lentisphaeria bacterium]